ncbi:MAG: hypothetical protein K9N06_00020 [Candidatus Cloacimonetes bacterium]|nr:hypothetical protein [Candidatus Cloacimonadota bacterium]
MSMCCMAALLAIVGKAPFMVNGHSFFSLLQLNEAVTSAEFGFVSIAKQFFSIKVIYC